MPGGSTACQPAPYRNISRVPREIVLPADDVIPEADVFGRRLPIERRRLAQRNHRPATRCRQRRDRGRIILAEIDPDAPRPRRDAVDDLGADHDVRKINGRASPQIGTSPSERWKLTHAASQDQIGRLITRGSRARKPRAVASKSRRSADSVTPPTLPTSPADRDEPPRGGAERRWHPAPRPPPPRLTAAAGSRCTDLTSTSFGP